MQDALKDPRLNLDNVLLGPVAHQARNLHVRVKATPYWMDKTLAADLKSIFEDRALRYVGLVSGFEVSRATLDRTLAFEWFDMTVAELSNCEISETLNLWVKEARRNKGLNKGAPGFDFGITLQFFELDATNSRAVRAWELEDVFPTSTGHLDAHFDRAAGWFKPLTEEVSHLHLRLGHNKHESKYNTPELLEELKALLETWAQGDAPYLTPVLPGSVMVFTPDEHDPDVRRTMELVMGMARDQGINLVVLDQATADILKSDEPIDFEALMAGCVKPPAEWESNNSGLFELLWAADLEHGIQVGLSCQDLQGAIQLPIGSSLAGDYQSTHFGTEHHEPELRSPQPVPGKEVIPGASREAYETSPSEDPTHGAARVRGDNTPDAPHYEQAESHLIEQGQKAIDTFVHLELGAERVHGEGSLLVEPKSIGKIYRDAYVQDAGLITNVHRERCASVQIPPSLCQQDTAGNAAPEGWAEPGDQVDPSPAQDASSDALDKDQ